jgi:signal recognition particle subunit SEC65
MVERSKQKGRKIRKYLKEVNILGTFFLSDKKKHASERRIKRNHAIQERDKQSYAFLAESLGLSYSF